jgi:hypothetical protein
MGTTDTSPSARSQCERILAILESGHSLTPLTALQTIGCMALSQRCGQLRRRGYNIVAEMVHDEHTGKRYASYRLARPAEQMELVV